MKALLSTLTLSLLLAACGKDGAENYVGFWQPMEKTRSILTGAEHIEIFEIKKENGQYFASSNILNKQGQQQLLTEKDGQLVISTGMGEIPLALSDDKTQLFVRKARYQKIDAATKDKIVAHQQKCAQIIDEYRQAERKLPSITSNEYRSAKETLEQRYFPQLAELEKEMTCNDVPYFYRESKKS